MRSENRMIRLDLLLVGEIENSCSRSSLISFNSGTSSCDVFSQNVSLVWLLVRGVHNKVLSRFFLGLKSTPSSDQSKKIKDFDANLLLVRDELEKAMTGGGGGIGGGIGGGGAKRMGECCWELLPISRRGGRGKKY